MDYIWTPWRYQYMKQVEAGKQPECIFCDAASRKDDSETLVCLLYTSETKESKGSCCA